MSKDTGGPAFPVGDDVIEHPGGTEGMTLRDYFAAAATDLDVAAMRERVPRTDRTTSAKGVVFYGHGQEPDNWRTIARYLHADAMLAERAK